MDTKRFLFCTIAGGIAYFLLGFLMYGILFEDFLAEHSVSGIWKSETEMKYYPLAMGNLFHAALLAYIFLKWARIRTFSEGLLGGAIIGFFMTAGFNLVTYDTVKFMSIEGTLTDIAIYTIMTSITGGVVGAVAGIGSKS
jgi:uncharacterized membrane protein